MSSWLAVIGVAGSFATFRRRRLASPTSMPKIEATHPHVNCGTGTCRWAPPDQVTGSSPGAERPATAMSCSTVRTLRVLGPASSRRLTRHGNGDQRTAAPAPSTPARVPGSARRTSTIDTSRPGRKSRPAADRGHRARPRDAVERQGARVASSARVRLDVDGSDRSLLEITTDPEEPALARAARRTRRARVPRQGRCPRPVLGSRRVAAADAARRRSRRGARVGLRPTACGRAAHASRARPVPRRPGRPVRGLGRRRVDDPDHPCDRAEPDAARPGRAGTARRDRSRGLARPARDGAAFDAPRATSGCDRAGSRRGSVSHRRALP